MTAPLNGITILDLTQVLAGPFASVTLAGLGATVIKVERPLSGDDSRHMPPFSGDKSAYFAAVNHSKKSIALDLKADADRKIFERLLPHADVLLESARPGAMERLGYGWDDLHAVFPKLIYGSVSGYGQTGPDAKRPVYDLVAQARGGLMSMTGASGQAPLPAGAAIADMTAGMVLVQGVLAALIARQNTGHGSRVDISLLDAQVAVLEQAIASTSATGEAPVSTGARHKSIAPCETFHTSDGVVVIAIGNDTLFEKLCVALNLPLSDDPRFATNAARVEHARLLKRLIEAITLDNTCAHWIAKLGAAGIPSSPVQTIDQVMRDPQVIARNMIVDVLDRNGRPAFKAAGNPIKMTGLNDTTVRQAAPDLDANRGEILRWLAEDG